MTAGCMQRSCPNVTVYAKGYCEAHYNRARRGKDMDAPLRDGSAWKAAPGVDVSRFWSKVDKTPTCWLWTGTISRGGYGQFAVNRKLQSAHRVSYELVVGPIPDGLHIDHLCRVRNCVNPVHMEPVLPAENTRRGLVGAIQRNRTHCPAGHEYTAANTNVKNGKRHCRKCAAAYARAKRAREKEGNR